MLLYIRALFYMLYSYRICIYKQHPVSRSTTYTIYNVQYHSLPAFFHQPHFNFISVDIRNIIIYVYAIYIFLVYNFIQYSPIHLFLPQQERIYNILYSNLCIRFTISIYIECQGPTTPATHTKRGNMLTE